MRSARIAAGRCIALLLTLLIALPLHAQTPWRLVKSYPHDPAAFTQGLFYLNGALYESTGLEGRSDIRKVNLKTGKVVQRAPLKPAYFGEGITQWGDRIVSITWQSQQGFLWRLSDFAALGSFSYPGEGWGLTQDGRSIVMSDGTAQLRFLDPETLTEQRRITVRWNGQPVRWLNELEYVKGEIWANIWFDTRIVRIAPDTGAVIDWLDIAPLAAKAGVDPREQVANGIAYDPARDRLFVTGKNWPRLFEIKMDKPRGKR